MKNFKKMLAVLLSLALCVSIVVPVLAAARVVTCGHTAHTHTSACYAESAVLTCGLEETESEVVEVKTTETVTDEETGETKEVETIDYKVVPGHTHGAGCYAEESVLVCGTEEHQHVEGCYGREVDTDNVTPPTEFKATDKDGNIVDVVVGEDGKLTVDGKEFKGEVTTTKVESKPVGTTVSENGVTTSEETSRVENEDGSITIETTYTTTYTTQDTTGYWVTYTVTYKEKDTYSVESNTNDNVVVGVDEKGNAIVTGIKDGLKLKGSDGVEYPVTKDADGNYSVTIDGTAYKVEPVVTGENGNYTVTWSFADPTAKPSYEKETQAAVTVQKDKDLIDAMTVGADGEVTLDASKSATKEITLTDGSTVTLKIKNGKAYVVDGGKEYEVEKLTATGNAKDGYTLSWSYTVVTPPESIESNLPADVTVEAGGRDGKTLIVKGPDGKPIASTSQIDNHPIESITINGTDNDRKVTVTCKDQNGSVYVYVIGTTSLESEGYTVEYRPVSSVTTQEVSPSKQEEIVSKYVDENDGHRRPNQEFIGIVLPDGSYLEVDKGPEYTYTGREAVTGNGGSWDWTQSNTWSWLVSGEVRPDVTVTVKNGSKIEISIKVNDSGNITRTITKNYDLAGSLPEGYTIENVVYSEPEVTADKSIVFDYVLLYFAGIVVKDELGNVRTMTLTADDQGNLQPTETLVEDSAIVGGTTITPAVTETIYVSLDALTGSAVVVVKTEGGDEVEMTYGEYLEAVENGENLELKGVLASTIPAPEDDDPEESNPVTNNPVIPIINDIPPVVINDEQPPLEEAPDVEIPDEETPLDEAPDEVEIPEVEVPLSDIPLTGDNSYIWRTIALVSGLGLVWLALDKKREGSAE